MHTRFALRGEAPARLRVSDADLAAYVAGGLGAERRAEIAGFLACNPDLAARVMRALHQQGRAQPVLDAVSARRRGRLSRLILGGFACAVAGWGFATGLDNDGPLQGLIRAPEYVEDAVMSWRATGLRMAMHDAVPAPQLDASRLQQATRIALPALPAAWRVLDVQVYPSEWGPGISVLLEATPGRQVNLLALRATTAASNTPKLTATHNTYAAYWETAGSAFVLTGQGQPQQILDDARLLAHAPRP